MPWLIVLDRSRLYVHPTDVARPASRETPVHAVTRSQMASHLAEAKGITQVSGVEAASVRLEAREDRLQIRQGHAGGPHAAVVVVEAAVYEAEQRLGGQRQ